MKTFFVLAALCISSFAFAQKHNSLSQSINENNNKLSIKIKGTINGKEVDYNRTFDITGFTKEEREALKERVFDSLGIPAPAVPVPPVPPGVVAPVVKAAPVVTAAPSVKSLPSVEAAPVVEPAPVAEPTPVAEPAPPVKAVAPEAVVSVRNQYEETYVVAGDKPYTKEIKYNPRTSVLYMKYRFKKDGEEITYERSVEVKDSSKAKRDGIIRDYENEIGLTKK